MITPDTQETMEQIAERIAISIPQRAKQAFGREQVKEDILSALRNERERAAMIADREAQRATRDEALSNDDGDRGRCQAACSIAAAIREGR